MQSEGSQKENLNRIITVPNLLSFFRFCLIPVTVSYTHLDDIKVIEVKDYIKNPKSNGYRSYHMIVEIPVFFAKGKTPMRVELQIRTNGMDFWATLEHQPVSYTHLDVYKRQVHDCL